MNFLEEAKKYEKDFLADLNSLVEVESTRDLTTKEENAPFGKNCREVLTRMLNMGAREGFETKDVDGYAGVISYGKGEETFGVLGHLDIVPLGEDWTKDPLKVTQSQGYIFGRGVMDDKGPTLAAFYALKMVKDLNIPLKKRVMLISGCDEESGMECMNYYKKHEEIPQMGFVPDAMWPVLYGEKGLLLVQLRSQDKTVIKKLKAGSRPNIVIGKADAYVESIGDCQRTLFDFFLKANQLKGSIQEEDGMIRLHIDGQSAHGAWPYLGNNAALHLLNFIGSAYNDTLANDLYEMLKDWMGKPVDIFVEGEYMSFLTMNTGIVDIENNETCVTLDIRYPNDTNEKELMAKFESYVQNIESNIEPVMVGHSQPLFVDPNSKLVQDLAAIYRKYTKDSFHGPQTIGGGTYARHFKNFVSYGPEKPWEIPDIDEKVGGCHQADEGIKLATLIESIAIYADAIVTLCS